MAEALKNSDCKDCGCEITEHYWRCKPCSRAYAKAWRAANLDKCKLYDKRKGKGTHPSITTAGCAAPMGSPLISTTSS